MNETARQYIQRITAHVGGKPPLAIQAATAKKLERLIKGVPASKLRKRPSAGEWSPGEIVAHLGDAEIVIGFRMRLILGAPGSSVAAYDQDSWVTSGHYEKRLKAGHRIFRLMQEFEHLSGFPARKSSLVDTVYFGDSSDSRALQLADVCCSTICLQLRGHQIAEPYYDLIRFRIQTSAGNILYRE